ncbi:NEDD4-binding protein 2-like 1 [Crotalus adamanteus]|uniref:NEDD4-binding protein 2-like 1 n=1 Tax=Crotalus adamanteus TaxID=8729 RepID=A0AAW1BE02_CROAD
MEDSLIRAFRGLSLQQPHHARGRPPAHCFSKSLYLLCGLPGSGKSTLARLHVGEIHGRKLAWFKGHQEHAALAGTTGGDPMATPTVWAMRHRCLRSRATGNIQGRVVHCKDAPPMAAPPNHLLCCWHPRA